MDFKAFTKRIAFEPNTGCWLWIAEVNPQGYGIIAPKRNNGFKRVHRYSYFIFKGSFDLSLMVCHHCDVPGCVNPDHLFLGDAKKNADDRDKKNRNNPRRGSENGNSKLKIDQVVSIRREYIPKVVTARILGEKYNVDPSTILDIVNKTIWRHV